MREIFVSADRLVTALLGLPEEKNLCLLDSCGVGHLGSHLLIAGFAPVEVLEISDSEAAKTLALMDEKLSKPNLAAIFTISYDFGLKLENIAPREKKFSGFAEPDVFLALFDVLIVHDYDTKKTFLAGDEAKFDEIENAVLNAPNRTNFERSDESPNSKLFSNFTKSEYENAVEKIKERIRRGDTYQTNLTRQIRVELAENISPEQIFWNLRRNHPAPFAAFLRRKNDVVISASPERFFRVESRESRVENFSSHSPLSTLHSPLITVSPIKGTRPRGKTAEEDLRLKNELLNSEKDRAENVMIVDLLRNDIGRICEFGTVAVEKLCDLEEHPTLFHLVSTVSGALRDDVKFSDLIRAVFPCGSITGAPKIRTMRIIDEIETSPRGLSMGAIGFSIPDSKFQIPDSEALDSRLSTLDCSVAIRTMVVRGREAIFNVGGGIVIDSAAADEFAETVVKSKALLASIGISQD
jgi:para-aminobenzoate synthetase component I